MAWNVGFRHPQFYVMAYPRVVDPGLTYTLFFFLTVLKNVFYLGFMTDPYVDQRCVSL
jgi:hypothetical protein